MFFYIKIVYYVGLQTFYFCMGGQGVSAYEQNTQQSPSFGLKTDLQFSHSYDIWQKSKGIFNSFVKPHSGHVNFAVVLISVICCPMFFFVI